MKKKTTITSNLRPTNFISDFYEIYLNFSLISTMFKRDMVSIYRQTVLGPIWFIATPIATSAVFTVVFGQIAQMSTDGIPPFLFYLVGLTMWNYFLSTVIKCSNVFQDNYQIFSKIYFPRIAAHITSVLVNITKFLIQYILFLIILLMSDFDKSFLIYNLFLLKLIFCIAYMAILSVGLGMLISVTMVKYKDVMFAYNFILSLILYVSPVLFPFSSVSGNLKLLLYLNPLTFPIEYMKIIHLNVGTLDFNLILINSSITILIFLFGYLLFKKVEQTFVDIF